jgi:hypothetical protein
MKVFMSRFVSWPNRDEEAISRCEIALEQRDNENPQGALEITYRQAYAAGTSQLAMARRRFRARCNSRYELAPRTN